MDTRQGKNRTGFKISYCIRQKKNRDAFYDLYRSKSICRLWSEAEKRAYMKVIIVGAGFSGLTCAQHLVKDSKVHVTLIDSNNFSKFTPLLYQVATSELSSDAVATPLRLYFEDYPNIDIKMATAKYLDPKTNTIYVEEGQSYQADYIVLACGSAVNFFGIKGADLYSFPLYTLDNARKLRSQILGVFEAADNDPSLIEKGILNFVIVGAGPTGIELSGAIADMLHFSLPKEFRDLAVERAKIVIVDGNASVLKTFSEESRSYAQEVVTKRGVELKLGLRVQEVTQDFVILSNNEKILAKTVIWAGGIHAASFASSCGLLQGHGGRIEVNPDLSVKGYPNIFALGDFANIAKNPLPQLASVATQAGAWTANAILKNERKPFEYNDKGIMAMIGRNAAIAEIGTKRKELTGVFAYAAWTGVHLSLLATYRQKLQTLLDLLWNYFSKNPAIQILDKSDYEKPH